MLVRGRQLIIISSLKTRAATCRCGIRGQALAHSLILGQASAKKAYEKPTPGGNPYEKPPEKLSVDNADKGAAELRLRIKQLEETNQEQKDRISALEEQQRHIG